MGGNRRTWEGIGEHWVAQGDGSPVHTGGRTSDEERPPCAHGRTVPLFRGPLFCAPFKVSPYSVNPCFMAGNCNDRSDDLMRGEEHDKIDRLKESSVGIRTDPGQ